MNQRTKGILRAIAAALIITFITQDMLWANPNALSGMRLSPGKLHVPDIPVSVATVSGSHAARSPKTLYLIQDAHTNESAQLNIAKSLDLLIRKEGVNHVFMEAGWGDASLSHLRKTASQGHREKTARSFLREGILSGAEYLDLTSAHDLVLWGVENEELYWKSIEAYRKAAEDRDDLENYLKLAEQTVRALKSRTLNPSLRLFDAKREAFLNGGSAFAEYFAELSAQAEKRGIGLSYFPHLSLLRNVLEKEKTVDFEKAGREQLAALQTLSPEDLELLSAASREKGHAPVRVGRADQRTERGFYALLRDKVRDLSAYPELSKYLGYLDAARAIDAGKLLDEQKMLEGRITAALAQTEDEARLCRTSDTLRNLKGLLALTLTPDEYASLKSDPIAFDIAALTGFLNLKIMELKGLYEHAIFLKGGLEGHVRAAREFYELTAQRDREFLSNTLEKMEKEGVHKAVVIAGGYHEPNLTSLLKSLNVSYVSLTPQVLHETNQTRYEALLLSQEPARPRAAGEPAADKIGIRLVRFNPPHESVLTGALSEKPVLAAARPAGARLADGSMMKDEPEVKSTVFNLTGRIPIVMTFDGLELRFRTVEEGEKRIDKSFRMGAIPALIKLGSGPDNDIVVPVPLGRVSPNHAHISIEGDGSIYLTDVSALGTFFGMLRIGQSQRVKLMTIPELGYGTKSVEGQPVAVRPAENMETLFMDAKRRVRKADVLMMAGSIEEASKEVSEAMRLYSKIRRSDTDYVRRSEAAENMKLLEARQHQLSLSIDRQQEKLRVFEWRGEREGQPTRDETTYLSALREGKPTAAVSLFARDWRGRLYLQRAGDLFGLAYPGALGPTVSGRVREDERPDQALKRLFAAEWGIELDPRRLKRIESVNNDKEFGLRSSLDRIEYTAQTGEEWNRIKKFREEVEAREKEEEPNPLKRVTFSEHVGFRRMFMRIIEPSSMKRLLGYASLLEHDKDLPIPPSDVRHQRVFKSVWSYEFNQAELEKIEKRQEEAEAEETGDTKIRRKVLGLEAVDAAGLYEDFLSHPEKYALDSLVPGLTTAYFRQRLFGQKARSAERTSGLETQLAGTRQKIQNWHDGRGITGDTREKVMKQIEPFLEEISLVRQDAGGFVRTSDRQIENVYETVRGQFPDTMDLAAFKTMIRRVTNDHRASSAGGERIAAALFQELQSVFGKEKVSSLESYHMLAGMLSDEAHERRVIETGDDLYQLYALFLEVFEKLTYDAEEIRNKLVASAKDPEEMRTLLQAIAEQLTKSPPKRLDFLKGYFTREEAVRATSKLVISIANSPHEFSQHLRLLLRFVSEIDLASSGQQRFLRIEKERIIGHVNEKHIRLSDEKLDETSEKIVSGELKPFDQGAMTVAYKIQDRGIEFVLLRPAFLEALFSSMEEKPDLDTLGDLTLGLAFFLNEIDMIRTVNPSGLRDDMQYLVQAVEGQDFLALESHVVKITEALIEGDQGRAFDLYAKLKEELEGIYLFRIEQQFPLHSVSLRKMMKIKSESGGWELRQVLRLGVYLASAYEHQATVGIVNRDIKPENIFVSESVDRVRTVDLGISLMPWTAKGRASLTDVIRELEAWKKKYNMTGGYYPGEALKEFDPELIGDPRADFVAFWVTMLQAFGFNPWKPELQELKRRNGTIVKIKVPKSRETMLGEIIAQAALPQPVKEFLTHSQYGIKLGFTDFDGKLDQEKTIALWAKIKGAHQVLYDGSVESADKTFCFTAEGSFAREPTIEVTAGDPDPRAGARLAAADEFRREKLTEAVQHLNLFFSAGGNDQAEGDMMSAFEHVGDGTDKFSGLMPAVNELADFIRESAKETTNANQMRLRLQPINDLLELIPSKPSIVFALKDYPEPFSILWPSSGEGETAGARLAVAESLGRFGIAVAGGRADLAGISKSAPWVMTAIRPIEDGPVFTDPAAMPSVKLSHDVALYPKLSEEGTNADGVFIGVAEIAGFEQPVVVKLIHRSADVQIQNEIINAQVYDRLGIGPRFYGVSRDPAGRIAGYAMQLVLGRPASLLMPPLNAVADADALEIKNRAFFAGLFSPAEAIETPSGRLVAIDAGDNPFKRRSADMQKRLEAFLARSSGNQGARLAADFSTFMGRELWAVHATNYPPVDQEVLTRMNATRGAFPRNTTHWALNHVVAPVAMGGDWRNKNYFVAAKLQDLAAANPGRALGGTTVDFMFFGNTRLPSSAKIFRSQEEVEQFLLRNNVQVERGSNWGWGGSWDVTKAWTQWARERDVFPAAHTFHWTAAWEEHYGMAPRYYRAYADIAQRKGLTRASPPDEARKIIEEVFRSRSLKNPLLPHLDAFVQPTVHPSLAEFTQRIADAAIRKGVIPSEDADAFRRFLPEQIAFSDEQEKAQIDVSEAVKKILPDLPLAVTKEHLSRVRQEFVLTEEPSSVFAEGSPEYEVLTRFDNEILLADQGHLEPMAREAESHFDAVRRKMEEDAAEVLRDMKHNGVSLENLDSLLNHDPDFQWYSMMSEDRDPFEEAPSGLSGAIRSPEAEAWLKSRFEAMGILNDWGRLVNLVELMRQKDAGARLAKQQETLVKPGDAITFALEVYDAKKETGRIMLGPHRLKIEKNKQNGRLRIHGLGDEPIEVKNYRKNKKPMVTLSMTDLRQEFGQDVTAVNAALAEIDTSIPVVAEVDLAVFRNENSGELVFPLLVRELTIARRLNAVVLLKGETREVEEVLSQAEAWYQKKQNFIFKKNEDIPEYYRSGKRVVIASADDEESRPGAGERYLYLKPLGADGLHNLQAIFKTAIFEARIENLETSDPRFVRFLHAYKILLGNREIADVSEFIEVLNGANKNLSAILKYAVPPKPISLNALFRVYELMKRMAEQAA
jgi:hypothetical protein